MIAIASGKPNMPARDGLRRAAGGDPDGQGVLQRARVDALAVQGRAELTLPDRMRARPDREHQVEFFREQRVVVVKIVAEQRKGFDKGTAPGHDFRAPARKEI
jgi:hypothetical protein